MASTSYRHDPYSFSAVAPKDVGETSELAQTTEDHECDVLFGDATADFEGGAGMGCPLASGLSESDSDGPSRSVTPATSVGLSFNGTTAFGAASDDPPFYYYESIDVRDFGAASAPAVGGPSLVRLFVGQMPYHMTAGTVSWLLWLLSGGRSVVHHVEKIVRWTQNRQACGCFHVYCRAEDAEALLSGDQRALCGPDGVWVAETDSQRAYLGTVCERLRSQRAMREPLMPYQLVTVQAARSTYVRAKAHRQRPPCTVASSAPAMFNPHFGPSTWGFSTHAEGAYYQ